MLYLCLRSEDSMKVLMNEDLKYQLTGYSSVRLSNRFVHRLIFRETPDGLEIQLIDIDDTHYGNK